MTPATLVFVSGERAFRALSSELPGYDTVEISAETGYMHTLIDKRCAMVFIDARKANWRSFTLAPKASAATRRIPVLVVSDDASQRAEATLAGADLSLNWLELRQRLLELIKEFARIQDAKTLAKLDCQCAEELPELAIKGVGEFNNENYYRQHDMFEAQWVQTKGPVRDLYRAILQVGVAYFHIQNGNGRGALKMLQRSVQWLSILPESCQGIDVAGLRRDSYAVRAEIERLGPERLDELNMSMLKPVLWLPGKREES